MKHTGRTLAEGSILKLLLYICHGLLSHSKGSWEEIASKEVLATIINQIFLRLDKIANQSTDDSHMISYLPEITPHIHVRYWLDLNAILDYVIQRKLELGNGLTIPRSLTQTGIWAIPQSAKGLQSWTFRMENGTVFILVTCQSIFLFARKRSFSGILAQIWIPLRVQLQWPMLLLAQEMKKVRIQSAWSSSIPNDHLW